MPSPWAAESEKPGVNLIEASDRGLDAVRQSVAGVKRPGDVLIASVHAGNNYGHEVEPAERDLFRRLIDEAGFDLIQCHSSHHVKAIELHNGRPILYGTGDLINDYEGLPVRPECAAFSPNVGTIAFADFSPASGAMHRSVPVSDPIAPHTGRARRHRQTPRDSPRS